MAGWNGLGVFVRAMNWVADKAAAIKITASRMDTEFDNYKTGLENCITRDGQTPPTADIPWNSKKITGLATGVSSTDAINLGQLSGLTSGNAFRKNLLVNGDFSLWQSSTGASSASVAGTAARIRTADCWWAIRQGTTGYTVSAQGGTSSRYALKWQRDNGNASTQNMLLAQSIESDNVLWMKFGTPPSVTVSFYAKKGANYSGGDLTVELVRGTGVDECVLDGYTGSALLGAAFTQTLSATLTRYSFTRSADASTNELGLRFTWTPTGAAGADDSVTLEAVQVEVANAATDFDRVPISENLARCQRYYQKSFAMGTAPAQNIGFASGLFAFTSARAGANTQQVTLSLPVCLGPMSYTGTLYNPSAANGQVRDDTAGGDCSASSILDVGGNQGAQLRIITTGNAATAVGNMLSFYWTVAAANF
jgi:hypothetical protein